MTSSMPESWDEDLVTAEKLIPIIGRLYRQNGVVLSIHGRSLINRSPIQLLKAHRYARHIDGRHLDVSKCAELVELLDQLELELLTGLQPLGRATTLWSTSGTTMKMGIRTRSSELPRPQQA